MNPGQAGDLAALLFAAATLLWLARGALGLPLPAALAALLGGDGGGGEDDETAD